MTPQMQEAIRLKQQMNRKSTLTPDLIVASVSNPSASVTLGSSFVVTDTTRNTGTGSTLVMTVTKYYLSADSKVGNDVYLGMRTVAAGLAAGANSSGQVTVTIPSTTPVGSYYLVACANADKTEQETNEGNNCRFSTTKISVPLLTAVPPDSTENTMISLINTYRQQHSLSILTGTNQLQAAADWMAADLTTRSDRMYTHDDSLGRNFSSRLNDYGGCNTGCGEIMANSTLSENATLALWQNSPPYNQWLLDPYYKKIGAAKASGINGVFWVIDCGY
ncbi:MAG: CAP domain-containing protein [Bacteroidia bacterium]|nr:CAP domain-containing protein [Bacteroidia bacterium]